MSHAHTTRLGPVRTLVLKGAVGLITAVLGSSAVLVALVSRRRAVLVAHWWGRALVKVAGVDVRVEGLDFADPGERYVIMANHESGLDIPALLTALPASLELRFLAKKSLFGVPFLGWAMRAMGFIAVDREDRSTAAAMLAKTIDEIRKGGSPLVFPEETWTLDGRLLPFQRGGFLVAMKTGLSILPVGLEGPRLVLPPEQGLIRPGPVTVRIGRPIATSAVGISQRGVLEKITRTEIDRLRGPSGHIPDDDCDNKTAGP
jgi:1-acyl-sn-glycerol-3-phosphate acyltransferase